MDISFKVLSELYSKENLARYKVTILNSTSIHNKVDIISFDTQLLTNQVYSASVENEDEKTLRIKGNLRDKIQTGVEPQKINLQNWLRDNKVDTIELNEIYVNYEKDSITFLEKNPYILCDFNYYFKNVDTIAKRLKIKANNPNRVKAVILLSIRKYCEKGHMYILNDELEEEVHKFLKDHSDFKRNVITSNDIGNAVQQLQNEEKIISVHNKQERICLYIKELYDTEENIYKNIKKLLVTSCNELNEQKIQNALKEYSKTKYILNEQQKKAVVHALTNRISLVTGFPGTGKSIVIRVIVDMITKFFPLATIECAAFAGKAVQRLEDVLKGAARAQTIHRLLQHSIGGTEQKRTIHVDYLLIDECSMIDAKLFGDLLESISDNTCIVLVGDTEQLPSIGSGQVFKDLIDSELIKSTKLNIIFRQSAVSSIVRNAHKIANYFETVKNQLEFDEEFKFIPANNNNEVVKQIENVYEELLENGYSIKDIQVLSTIRDGDLGIKELNEVIRHITQEGCSFIENIGITVADRVIQKENNYDIQRYNGETGIVMQESYINKTHKVEVEFLTGEKETYENKQILQLELAYCISVHKAQGSEFPVVIIPVKKEHIKYLNRNLIYTACTRAKQKVVLIGEKDILYEAINKKYVNRHTRLTEMLQEESSKESVLL